MVQPGFTPHTLGLPHHPWLAATLSGSSFRRLLGFAILLMLFPLTLIGLLIGEGPDHETDARLR